VDVYLTNELPPKTLEGLKAFLLDPGKYVKTGRNGTSRDAINCLRDLDSHLKLWTLKSDTPYGSIPIHDSDPNPIPSTHEWVPYDNITAGITRAAVHTTPIAAKIANKRSNLTAPPPPKRRIINRVVM
jgi:hypothetical protein